MSRKITKEVTENTKAAIYCRVSTDEQAQSGLGIEAQLTRARAQATVKGWKVVKEYIDAGISGTKDIDKRPALSELINDAKAARFDVVIILSLDRLGRKTSLVLRLVEEFAALDVDLISCKESLDTTTATGKFVLTMFASLAQLERDLIAERTTAALTELGKQKGYKGGRIPFGYVYDAERIVVEPLAAATVKEIFALKETGLTLRAIASRLDSPTPQGGVKWYASTVNEILSNKAIYAGEARYGGETSWPNIL